MQVIRRLQVIALSREEVESRVAGLTGAASEVRDVLPSLLLAAITATHHIYTTGDTTTYTTKVSPTLLHIYTNIAMWSSLKQCYSYERVDNTYLGRSVMD